MPASRHKFLFVLNRGSGQSDSADLERQIRNVFEKAGRDVRFFYLPDPMSEQKLKKMLRDYYPHCVVAVGGDGTVNLVAGLVAGKKTEMGILPAGSANGMAKELGIKGDFSAAMQLLLEGESFPTDLLYLNRSAYCLHLADLGINAQLVYYFEQGKFRGFTGYALALVKALFRRRFFDLQINTGKDTFSRQAAMIIIANSSKYGTGAVINPDGITNDGKFELVIVKKIAFSQILTMFIKSRQFDPSVIEIVQAEHAEITCSKAVHFQVDGEYKGKRTHVSAGVMPGALNLIMPARENTGPTGA